MFIIFIWYFLKYTMHKIKINRTLKNVEVLDGELPIVGHIFRMNFRKGESEDFYNLFVELTTNATYDRRFWLFYSQFLLAADHNTIEKILTSPDAVEKPVIYSKFCFILDGIFSAPTDEWRRMRKRLNQTFSPRLYPLYINHINYQTNILINKIYSTYRDGEQFKNILPLVSKYFFAIITSTHFGVDTKQQHKEESTFAEVIVRYTSIAFKRILHPLLYPDFTFRKSKIRKELSNMWGEYATFLKKFANKSEEYQKHLEMKGNTFRWKSYAVLCKETLAELGKEICLSRVGRKMGDLIIGGADTGAIALSNLLYHLGLHPEYQEIAYNEVMSMFESNDNNVINQNKLVYTNKKLDSKLVFGHTESDGKDRNDLPECTDNDWEFINDLPPSYALWTRNKIDRLQYLDMLIKESLRLCSPPFILRYIKTNLDVGDYVIPKGTNVAILIKNIQRNPMYWEKPEEFFPEHFSPENVKSRPKFSYMPFSKGPRDCPGKLFGMYTMKCALAEIIRNFTIETELTDTPTRHQLLFMIERVDGYNIKLVPRCTT